MQFVAFGVFQVARVCLESSRSLERRGHHDEEQQGGEKLRRQGGEELKQDGSENNEDKNDDVRLKVIMFVGRHTQHVYLDPPWCLVCGAWCLDGVNRAFLLSLFAGSFTGTPPVSSRTACQRGRTKRRLWRFRAASSTRKCRPDSFATRSCQNCWRKSSIHRSRTQFFRLAAAENGDRRCIHLK